MKRLLLENVSFRRGHSSILKNINLQLNEGHHYCLIGPNGAGKTTLLSLISGMEWPTEGSVLLEDGKEVYHTPHVRSRFGHFFPRYAAWIEAYHPEITALELITTGFHQALAYYVEASDTEKLLARSQFSRHLPSIEENKSFASLSTGERFRVLLLRCLITKPDLVILDEPFDGLDLPGRRGFEKLILSTLREGSSLSLTVLHRIEEIPDFITDVFLLKEGAILASGPKEQTLTSENLSQLFDMKLICREHSGRYYVIYDERTEHSPSS